MATFYPAASGRNYLGDLQETVYCTVGNPSGTCSSQFAFTGVNIPQGSTIDSAVFTMYSYLSFSTTTVNLTFACLDYDNGGSGTSGMAGDSTEFNNITSATTNWNNVGAWTNANTYNSPDISSTIQEVIDRTGWHSGQTLCLTVRDNSSSFTASRIIYGGQNLSWLTLTWTAPAAKTISGSVKRFGTGIDGVTMTFSAGLGGGTATTAGGGLYTKSVAHDTSGTVTPSKTGETFTPSSKSYTYVRANQTSQDYLMDMYVTPPAAVAYAPKIPSYWMGSDTPLVNITYVTYAPSRNIYNMDATDIAYSAQTPTYVKSLGKYPKTVSY